MTLCEWNDDHQAPLTMMTLLQQTLSPAFTSGAVRGYIPKLERLARRACEAFAERRGGDAFVMVRLFRPGWSFFLDWGHRVEHYDS
jgi:hypothetical protein